MKLCDTCIYCNNVEQLKPCIIYRDNCEYYEREEDMKAIIQIDVPDYQIGQEVSIYFKDTMMIKGIVQEPSGDLISRQAVHYYIESHINEIITESGVDKNEHTNRMLRALVNGVDTMPSVTPTERTGHWIDEFGGCECSECGCLEGGYSDYCPDCGCRMVEPQESEET